MGLNNTGLFETWYSRDCCAEADFCVSVKGITMRCEGILKRTGVWTARTRLVLLKVLDALCWFMCGRLPGLET